MLLKVSHTTAWLGLAHLACLDLAIDPKSQILITCKSRQIHITSKNNAKSTIITYSNTHPTSKLHPGRQDGPACWLQTTLSGTLIRHYTYQYTVGAFSHATALAWPLSFIWGCVTEALHVESHLATELHIRNRDCASMGSGRKDRGFSNLPGVSTLQNVLSPKNKCIIFIYLPKYGSNFLMSYCITGNRKNNFIVFPSHKIIVQNIRSYWKLWNPW